MKIALFPGTFDPITLGHVDIIQRALPLFDRIYIGIGTNSNKSPMFPIDKRIAWIGAVFADYSQVIPVGYSGLTSKFCEEQGINFIIRGIRYVADFENEKIIADVNRQLKADLDTIIFTTKPDLGSCSSTIVRDIIRNGGDASQFLPKEVVF